MATRYGGRTEIPQVSQWLNPASASGLLFTNPRVGSTATVTVTADTNANTYGAWTELISSLSEDTSLIRVDVAGIGVNATNTGSVVSFGIGSSGSEVEICAVAVGSANAGIANGITFYIPFRFVSGTRIAARLQSVVTLGKTCTIRTLTYKADNNSFLQMPNRLATLGVSLAASEGTSIAASNTYSEIVASTSETYRGVVMVASAASTGIPAATGTMTLGLGSSGSEVEIGQLFFESGSNETLGSRSECFVSQVIPAGSRLAVKQTVNSTQYDVTLIGIPF